MAFVAGTKLGTYEIVGPLGKGGMGEVYRARDSRLKREVAIKVLPDEFCRDAERVSRFQREAEVLASLNHPHIASIHHLEEYEQSRLLVLELVEGETLADRVARGPLPADEAVEIAKQIAEALQAAHDKGIVHRDLKPANIKITPEGKVKVLDFGLAKVYESESSDAPLSHSPTLMSARTGGGVILGTVSYMSPEQARGRTVTKQTDIWAFGCVLFEMLTGCMAFSGETVSDTIAKILKDEPDWNATNDAVPQALRRIVDRCLQKDLQRRFHDAGDIRFDLDEIGTGRAGTTPQDATQTQPRAVVGRTAIIFALAILALAIAGIWLASMRTPPVPSWSGTRLGGPGVAWGPQLSPDGRLVAFQAMVDGVTQAAVMNPDSGDWRVLTRDRSRGYLSNVSWSHDSTRIYYGRVDGVPRGIFSVSALGGDERLVLEDASTPEALPDGTFLIGRVNAARQFQIHRFWPETGRVEPYPALAAGMDFSRMRVFRDGNDAVFWGKSLDQPSADGNVYLYILNINSGQVRRVAAQEGVRDLVAPLAVDPSGKYILTARRSADLVTIVEIPRSGGVARSLITMTDPIQFFDAGADGAIYLDQFHRPLEVLRLNASGAIPERILTSNVAATRSGSTGADNSGSMPDGRIIVTTLVSGRRRLAVARPGEDPTPFVQTAEETSGPVTMIGKAELAFVIGSGTSRKVATASASDGRVMRRFEKIDGAAIDELASSPDGKTLYYAAAGKIWALPSNTEGEPHVIREGDSVAVDPGGRYLIVQLNEKDNVRLVRVFLDGTPEEPLAFPGVRLAAIPLAANAVRADGVILKSLAVSSFDWAAGLLHPDTGKVERISLRSSLDVHYPTWSADGRILLFGFLTEGTLWRFTPETSPR